MTEANIDRIRRAYDAWNRGDLDAVMEYVDEDAEWRMTGEIVGTAEAYHGHAGVRSWWEQFTEPFEHVEIEPEEIAEPSDDQVLVRVRVRATGRQGVQVALSVSHLYELRDGKMTRARVFTDHAEALAAAAES